MTNITMLSEEEQKRIHEENSMPAEISGIGMSEFEEINDDDIMSLIMQANNISPTRKEPSVKNPPIEESLAEEPEEISTENFSKKPEETPYSPTEEPPNSIIDDTNDVIEENNDVVEEPEKIKETSHYDESVLDDEPEYEEVIPPKREIIEEDDEPIEEPEPVVTKAPKKSIEMLSFDFDNIKTIALYFLTYNFIALLIYAGLSSIF